MEQPPRHAATVVLAPHPDDETLGAGGWLAEHRGRLAIIFLTDGVPQDAACMAPGYSDPRIYGAVRRREARAACAVLCPAARLVFAPFGDQALHRSLDAAGRWLDARLVEFAPEAVLCPAYEAGHPDHDAASLLGALAAAQYGVPAWEYALYTLWRGQFLRQDFPTRGSRRLHCGQHRREKSAKFRSGQRHISGVDRPRQTVRASQRARAAPTGRGSGLRAPAALGRRSSVSGERRGASFTPGGRASQRAGRGPVPINEGTVHARRLPEALARRKRAALDCYRSQRHTLAAFDAARECMRPMPAHDFTRPARAEAVYERWGWPIRPAEVNAALRRHLTARLACAS